MAASVFLLLASSALAAEVAALQSAIELVVRAQARRLEGWRPEDRRDQCPSPRSRYRLGVK
eukprot:7775208-Lingulodinium_polyedra.AAC.1